MLVLNLATTDIVRAVTGSAADVEAVVEYIEYSAASPPVVQTGSPVSVVNSSITTAATTTVLAGSATLKRAIKGMHFFNRSATSTTLLVERFDNTNNNGLAFCTLLQNEALVFTEAGIWVHYDANGAAYAPNTRFDVKVYVASDVTNATTAFADVTGLTVALKSGKKYAFDAQLFHQTNATTTGANFGINIGAAPTAMILGGSGQITSSVTAAAWGASPAVTARDTAAVVETTGPGASTFLHNLTGFIQPSADGTFAIRCASEVAVAGGLVVKAGSWLRIWELDN